MIIIWMSRLEMTEPSGRSLSGLVSVGEEEGKWIVLWEVESNGETVEVAEDNTWYEGHVWAEMHLALRRGIARLLRQGYMPALGFTPDTEQHERRMKERNEWIHCYGDLNVDDVLYQQLVQWRKEVATSMRRAPYWITTNRMLRLVSAFVPQTLDELKQLPGFGEAKVNAYGEAILAITAAIVRKTTFPLNWVKEAVGPSAFLTWVYKQEEAKMTGELTRLVDKRSLIEAVQQGLQPEEVMQRLNIDRRELLVRIEGLDEEGYDISLYINQVLDEVETEVQQQIEQALSEMGMDYLKPIYIHVFGQESLKDAAAIVQRRYEYIRLVRIQMSKREVNMLDSAKRRQGRQLRGQAV